MGVPYEGVRRTSFLIDPEGKIAHIFTAVKPTIHAQEVLSVLKTLQEK